MGSATSVEEPKRSGMARSTSKRVRMIFSVMASPNRIDILRILSSKGPLTYSELKSLAGFRSKKESGKFAYHLRKLTKQSLVSSNKSERRYSITNLGKLVLTLVAQVEQRSIIESGNMYVRTSHHAIEEYNSERIIQSLVREGGLPIEAAEKITEEVGNRINKYQTAYLTSSLIRELVNSILLEHGYEECRGRHARLGLPVFDIHNAMVNADSAGSGAEGLLVSAGQRVFEEYLFANVLKKDVADLHHSGDLHITNPGTWAMIPDTLFVNIRELVADGVSLGGRHMGVSRVPQSRQLDGIASALSILIPLLSKEASQEVVLDEFVQLFSKHAKAAAEVEQRLAEIFASTSTAAKYGGDATRISIRLKLGTDAKIIDAILGAYRRYAEITPIPRIALIIDHERGRVSDVSGRLSEIIAIGGMVMFAKEPIAYSGIANVGPSSGPLSFTLQSVSINLPRLAFEANKDATYFRAILVLKIKPALESMAERKTHISDLTRRGLNPVIAKSTQYMQKRAASLVVNLVGLREAVFHILGYQDNKEGRDVLRQIVDTAVSEAAKNAKEFGTPIAISMVGTDGADRFMSMDGVKYGRNSAIGSIGGDSYSQGMAISASELASGTPKSAHVAECGKVSKILNGGMLVTLEIDDDAGADDINEAILRAAELVPSFRPAKKVSICAECGFKGGVFAEKCPKCKSSYIL